MRPAIQLAALLFLAAASIRFVSAADPPSDPGGWRSIPLVEDGHIADGWRHTGFGGFKAADGLLRTAPDGRGLGLLFYDKEKFGNCQLRIVYRSEQPRSNSGVYVRIDDGILTAKEPRPAERSPDGSLTDEGEKAMQEASEKHLGPWYAVHHGYEVQICDAADPPHRTGAVYSLTQAADFPGKPPGSWRTMVITLRGKLIDVDIDGKRVSSFDPDSPSLPKRKIWHEPEREPKRPEAGYIGLQNHDPGDIVEFKEIGVRPLPDGR
jgi:hypothetical protein